MYFTEETLIFTNTQLLEMRALFVLDLRCGELIKWKGGINSVVEN